MNRRYTMKITRQHLIDAGACQLGLKWFSEATKNTTFTVDVSKLVEKEDLQDGLWLAKLLIPKIRQSRFFLDIALTSIALIRDYIPEYESVVETLKFSEKVNVRVVGRAITSYYRARSEACAAGNTAIQDYENSSEGEAKIRQLLVDMFNEYD